jgi:biotin transporter BioY
LGSRLGGALAMMIAGSIVIYAIGLPWLKVVTG